MDVSRAFASSVFVVSASSATSRENQTRRMIETAARVEQVHRRIVGKGGWEGAANG